MTGDPHTTTATIFTQTADAAAADPDLFECCDPCARVSSNCQLSESAAFPFRHKERGCSWVFVVMSLRLPVSLESPFTQATIFLLSLRRSSDPRPSASIAPSGNQIRVSQLCVRHVRPLHFGLDVRNKHADPLQQT